MRKIPTYIILIVLILNSCYKEPHDYENHRTSYFKNVSNYTGKDSMLTCLTFNIQLGFNAYQDPWDADEIGGTQQQLDNLVQIIEHIDPIIIALQEVPRNRYNTEIKYYIEAIAERLDMNFSFGSYGYNDPEGIWPIHGEWGNAILSKYEILGIKNIEVSYVDKWGKRSILDALLKLNDTLSIHVISVHYGRRLNEYNDGLRNTKDYIKTITGPVILMGDFNPQFGPELLSNDLQQSGLSCSDAYSVHGGDMIFYSKKDFTIDNIGSYYDTINWTSDHPANYSTLKLNTYSHSYTALPKR